MAAPAFVGAVAQYDQKESSQSYLTGLVKSISELSVPDSVNADIEIINEEHSKIIMWGKGDFTELNDSIPENNYNEDSSSIIIYWGDEWEEEGETYTNINPEEKKMLSILDFMADIYDSHDFYQSGYWGKKNEKSYLYSGPKPDLKGYEFYVPVKGRLTSGYGYRERYNRVHKGLDIALSVGDTVRAALSGVISKLGNNPGGYGKYIIIVHNNGMETRYGHLNSFLVIEGAKVEGGEPIALGGNTGNSTGPHLHFETRFRGYALDPRTLFSFP